MITKKRVLIGGVLIVVILAGAWGYYSSTHPQPPVGAFPAQVGRYRLTSGPTNSRSKVDSATVHQALYEVDHQLIFVSIDVYPSEAEARTGENYIVFAMGKTSSMRAVGQAEPRNPRGGQPAGTKVVLSAGGSSQLQVLRIGSWVISLIGDAKAADEFEKALPY